MELTRESIQSGAYLRSFVDLPGQPRWPRERILAALHDALSRRPPGQPLWLFAYGSLIWNPLFRYAERQSAVLHGWQRRFCLRLLAGRGTPEQPGRMLALDAGGGCAGMAFRLSESGLDDELALVSIRELPYGSYRIIWREVKLADRRRVPALAFVANPAQRQYAADASIATVAPLVARARGPMGSNAQYLFQLEDALARHGYSDPHVDALAAAVRKERPDRQSRP
ncbi:MAG: gamma-glutamylcyclotransferase [Ottowia sp.]|nr:gamma-glutamylcyclotransferase [Ottowia sp.]